MLGFSPLAALPLGGLPEDGQNAIVGVHYVDPDTFGAATIGRGAVSITGTLYTDGDAFGAHTVSASYGIAGALYSDPDVFGAAAISVGGLTIVGSLYSDPDTFGSASFEAIYRIRPTLFNDPDIFRAAFVSGQVFEYVSPGHERCMRCGFIRGRSKMRKEWTGLLVCEDTCWEPKHPQMSLRGVPDNQTVPWTRPPPEPVFLTANQVTADSL